MPVLVKKLSLVNFEWHQLNRNEAATGYARTFGRSALPFDILWRGLVLLFIDVI